MDVQVKYWKLQKLATEIGLNLSSWPSKRLRISSGSPVWEAFKISSTSRKASFTGGKLWSNEFPGNIFLVDFLKGPAEMAPPTSPNFGGTANFAMSWETNLCNNYLEALGAALRSPGIAGIKRPAVGSDPSCWNCCPFLHLDLPIPGPQKILTCSLYCNLDSSQDCPLGTQTITFNKAKRMRRFWTSTSSTRLSLGFSTGFNSSQEYHLKRPASSKSCCKPSLIFSLKHPKTIPYPAKLAPKRHILQEVFQFICIYLPLGQAGPKHHDSQLGYFSPVGWTCFFGGIYGYLT